MKLISLSAIFLAIGCGSPDGEVIKTKVIPKTNCSYSSTMVGKIDEDLKEQVVSFALEATARNTSCTTVSDIGFDSQESINGQVGKTTTVGLCEMNARWILISRDFWSEIDDTTREILMFHELGHCALGLNHASENSINIMNPYVLSSSLYQDDREHLLDKLFSRSLD